MSGAPQPPFDLDRIRLAPLVAELRYFDTIESTNSAAVEAAREARVVCPTLFLAAEQTAGRGRGANRWHSSAGALTFSLLIEPPECFERVHWPKLALAVAVAICRALERFAPASSFGVRWPNDVYSGERKISGVLVEAPATDDRPRAVIGVGLNVNNSFDAAPADVQARAVSLAELRGNEIRLTDVLLQLLADVDRDLARLYDQARDLADDWQRLCLLRGRQVTLEQGARRITGRSDGIDRDGSLLIDDGRGPQRYYGGVLTAVR